MSTPHERMDLLARHLNTLRSMRHEAEIAEHRGEMDILDNAIYFIGRQYEAACEEYSRESVA